MLLAYAYLKMASMRFVDGLDMGVRRVRERVKDGSETLSKPLTMIEKTKGGIGLGGKTEI